MHDTKVILKTAYGDKVGAGKIPPFPKGREPEALSWKGRVFKFTGYANDAMNIVIYSEIFTYPLTMLLGA